MANKKTTAGDNYIVCFGEDGHVALYYKGNRLYQGWEDFIHEKIQGWIECMVHYKLLSGDEDFERIYVEPKSKKDVFEGNCRDFSAPATYAELMKKYQIEDNQIPF